MLHPSACRPIVLATLLLAAADSAHAQCPPRGLTLQSRGGRLGDSWSMELSGAPNVPGVVAFDVTPGPVQTPFGTLCLGVTPLLRVFTFVLDGAGRGAVGGLLPPDVSLSGATLYWSALGFDPAQPGGIALSNGAALTLREPRLYFVDPGGATPFGTTPGSVAGYRVITEVTSFSQALTTNVRDAAFVRGRDWLTILLGNGTVAAFDGTSGLPALNVTLTGVAASASKLLPLPDGDTVVLMALGTPPSPFSPGTPGSLHFLSLTSAMVTSSVALPAGNPDAILLAPGSNTLFLRLANAVQPVDSISGFVHPVITLPAAFGALVDWQVSGNVLYCLHGGRAPTPFGGGLPSALSAVDIATLGSLFTNQLAQAAPVSMLRAGPGTTGPSLYVYGATSATLAEFAQVTGTPTASMVIGNGIGAMELSALRTDWLLLRDGTGGGTPTLFTMPAGTMNLTTQQLLSGNAQPLLAVSPSAGMGRAGLVLGNNTLRPFGTDPLVPPFTSVVLPITSNLFKVVSD
jgi:hypothetical protein